VSGLSKRQFVIDTGRERIPAEGYEHKNVAVKYLMKRRRSLLTTRDQAKVDRLFEDLPREIRIIGSHVEKRFRVNWEKVGTTEFEGARFVFTLDEVKASP